MRNNQRLCLSKPQRRSIGEDFDVWCYVMVRRHGYAPAFVAATMKDESINASRIIRAVERVDCGRYGDPNDLEG